MKIMNNFFRGLLVLIFFAQVAFADPVPPPATFQLCFNKDPKTNEYWPTSLVPQGNSEQPYCITQNFNMAAPGNTLFVTNVYYAVLELVRHVRPSASLTQTPNLVVSMQYDSSGGNCAATNATSMSTDMINLRHYANPGALLLLNTGDDSAARNADWNTFHADIIMNCSTYDVTNHFWLDPRPWDRNTANAAEPGSSDMNKADFVSMQLHELLHGLGFLSTRVPQTGQYYTPHPLPSKFDTFVQQVNVYYPNPIPNSVRPFWYPFLTDDYNQAFFMGPHAIAYLKSQSDTQINSLPGVPVASIDPSEQISTQNFSHLGTIKVILPGEEQNPFDKDCLSVTYRTGVYKIFANDVMTMCYEPTFSQNYGIKNNRMFISPLDYAILQDLGYNVYMTTGD